MERSRKELLKEEIEGYEDLIKRAKKRQGSASVYSEIEVMNNFIKEYNSMIEKIKEEIEEITRNENENCLSGIDKLKAIQWYLREDKGVLLFEDRFRILDIRIDQDDDIVVRIDKGTEMEVDIHKLFDKMLNKKRRIKIQELLNEIFKKITKIKELANDWEIESIRDTILEAF